MLGERTMRQAGSALNPLSVESDDRALVDAARENPGAFAAIYECHFERVYAYIARRVRDRHTAEDLTADVFSDALASIRTFQWRGAPFASWLFRIASNAIADRFKDAARERAFLDGNSQPLTGAFDDADAERSAHLFRMVDGLPADQRSVIVMRFAQQRSIREIAAAMKRSEGAVKQLQFRALQSLRAKLGDLR